jgi:2-oxoisovalerate dehydrogenase E2 component (dihydrolipoyl transacylase)
MVASKRISPHVTTVFAVAMTQVVRHREAHKAELAQRGLRLTFTPYFVAAAAQALRRVPQVNARFHEDGEQRGIMLQRRIHIGVAVAVDGGLLVPVIRDADERNLTGLARIVGELAQAARNRKLAPDAMQGGTFTLTNHGTSGSLLGTPIINQPQGAILGIGAIVKRPVVRSATDSLLPSADDAIVIRPICFLSLTFDHRLIDGAVADLFMTAVKEGLEQWRADV